MKPPAPRSPKWKPNSASNKHALTHESAPSGAHLAYPTREDTHVMASNRTKICDNRRRAIFMRDKCQCVYCGKRVTLKHALAHFTLDHIVPVVLGGSNATENLITSCELCNKRKGRLTLTRFLLLNENEYNAGRRAEFILRVIGYRTSKPLGRKYGSFRI